MQQYHSSSAEVTRNRDDQPRAASRRMHIDTGAQWTEIRLTMTSAAVSQVKDTMTTTTMTSSAK